MFRTWFNSVNFHLFNDISSLLSSAISFGLKPLNTSGAGRHPVSLSFRILSCWQDDVPITAQRSWPSASAWPNLWSNANFGHVLAQSANCSCRWSLDFWKLHRGAGDGLHFVETVLLGGVRCGPVAAITRLVCSCQMARSWALGSWQLCGSR